MEVIHVIFVCILEKVCYNFKLLCIKDRKEIKYG